MNPIAAALDLGSTHIKVALLDASGELYDVRTAPFPSRERGDGTVEIHVEDFARRAGELVRSLPPHLPLGITSQRSSFVLFERRDSQPVAPALSWRDRRAASWCERHTELEPTIHARTGLRLSPHYAGPKIATLLEDETLRERVARGDVRFGTLDTYLLHRWSGGRVYVVDPSMAARTLLFDPRARAWSATAVAEFGATALEFPNVVESAGRNDELDGGRRVCASLADQGSGLLAVTESDDLLVNLGTGGFVLRSTEVFAPFARWLCGPTIETSTRSAYALEGTINGGASTLARWDSLDDAQIHIDVNALLCMPDADGWGAPHWAATRGVTFSAAHATAQEQRAAWFEGLVFRVREIVDAIGSGARRVRVAGGLARDPWIASALATCLGREVERVLESEATLLGVARLAAGLAPYADPPVERRGPDARLAHLADRYGLWCRWVRAGCPTR